METFQNSAQSSEANRRKGFLCAGSVDRFLLALLLQKLQIDFDET